MPCILFNEPYARDGEIDGIHVYDYSALSRFFDSPAFHFSRDHRLPDGRTARVEADVLRIWVGDKPSPEDLMAQLRAPYQLRVLGAQTECVSVGFGLDQTTAAISDRLIRRHLSEAELLRAIGVDPAPIMATLERGKSQIEALKAKAKAN